MSFRRPSPRVWRTIFGITLSAVAIVLLARSVDLNQVAATLRSANPFWVVMIPLLALFEQGLRGQRWRGLLAVAKIRVPYHRAVAYLLIGSLANAVLPLRTGEIVRARIAGDREQASSTTILGTILVERVIDVISLVLLATVTILIFAANTELTGLVIQAFVVMLIVVVALGTALFAHRLPGAETIARRTARIPMVQPLWHRLRDGMTVIAHPRTVIIAMIWSGPIWAVSVGTFIAAAAAIGVPITPEAAIIFAVGTALALIIPAGPGAVGTYEVAAVVIGHALGIASPIALSIGLLCHVVSLAAVSLGGLVSVAALSHGQRSAEVRMFSEIADPDEDLSVIEREEELRGGMPVSHRSSADERHRGRDVSDA